MRHGFIKGRGLNFEMGQICGKDKLQILQNNKKIRM